MSKKKKIQNNVWKYSAFLFGILLILSVFTNGFKGNNRDNDLPAKTTGNGKILIEEFSDFECPYCGRAFLTIEQILSEYGDQVEFVYKQFPLTSIHPNAFKAAEASECARDQDKFKEYHDKLFQNQMALSISNLKQYAADLGLDTDTFNGCLDNSEKASVVNNDLREGQQKGVTGTPTFFINNQKIVGAQPYQNFKAVIDQELAKVG